MLLEIAIWYLRHFTIALHGIYLTTENSNNVFKKSGNYQGLGNISNENLSIKYMLNLVQKRKLITKEYIPFAEKKEYIPFFTLKSFIL
jgi:hypothetical protein